MGKMMVAAATGLLAVMLATEAAADFATGVDALKTGDYETAYKEWAPLAEQGDAQAQFALANLYLRGNGVERDAAKALGLLTSSAASGYVQSALLLATLYQSGTGVERDMAKAAEYYEMAAEKDSADAQVNLAVLYVQGQGVAQDYKKASRMVGQGGRTGQPRRRVQSRRDVPSGARGRGRHGQGGKPLSYGRRKRAS